MNKGSLYVAMTKTSENVLAQSVRVNNLTQGNTPGFRATLVGERAIPAYGVGLPTTVFVGAENTGYDFTSGPVQYTGNSLDVAVNGEGWIAVQGDNGEEAYTRRGDLQVVDGLLKNGAGNVVIGDGGIINIPAAKDISITDDGTVKVTLLGTTATTVIAGKIKLVKAEPRILARREDGLFGKQDGMVLEKDPSVKLTTGGFEQSNVKPVAEMIDIINSARMHEIALKLMDKTEENDKTSQQLIQVNAR